MFGRHGLRLLDQFLDSPFSGLAPWVWMAMLAGPGRFEMAVAGALVVSLLVLALCWRRAIPVHVIEFLGVSYFVALAVIGLHASSATKAWLELWSGDITNALLACYAAVTLVIGQPYTMAYARHKVPPQLWGTTLFVRTNMVVTGVWAAAFGFAAISGFIGDALVHDTDNFWTGWVLQLAALWFAVAFTEFFPEHARARARGDADIPSWVRVIEWVPTFVIGTGVAGWLLHAVPDTGCLALVIVGAAGVALIHRRPKVAVPTDAG
ncbi:hypothetical protein ACXPWS_27655 [Mycobacterium sp. BMJ-28]